MTWLPWILCLAAAAAGGALGYVFGARAAGARSVSPSASAPTELVERELLLRTLLDASPLAVVFYSDVGRIVFANELANQLFFEGQSAEGKNFLRLVANGPEAFRPALLGANDEVVSFDLEGQRETYQLERRVFSFAGEPHTLLVVRHVTRQIARQELDVLKRVIRLLSHEVNNALAPVSSLVHSARQIVKTGERLDRLERVFNTVDERAKHLSQFIAGYASLARLPAPQPQEVEWESLLARLRDLYPRASVRGAEGLRGHFDPAQIEQALINLLKNALEAGGSEDAVELVIGATPEGSLVRVLDRGAGFSAEALENAVLPFFTTKPGGSGVGLALVREITDAHGGQLTLAAREGGGAVVSMLVPDKRKRADLGQSIRRLTLTRA